MIYRYTHIYNHLMINQSIYLEIPSTKKICKYSKIEKIELIKTSVLNASGLDFSLKSNWFSSLIFQRRKINESACVYVIDYEGLRVKQTQLYIPLNERW